MSAGAQVCGSPLWLLMTFCQPSYLLTAASAVTTASAVLLDLMTLSLATAPSVVGGYSRHDLECLSLLGQHFTGYGWNYPGTRLYYFWGQESRYFESLYKITG